MVNFKEISPFELNANAFKLIGQDWMLVSAEVNGRANAMTASWGGIGIMWGKPVAYIVVRPQRYTKEFIDVSEKFSLTFYSEEMRETLKYFGTTSGRDENKIAKSNLKIAHENAVPYFEEARLALICKNLFRQDMEESAFLNSSLVSMWYPKKDFHTLYIAEIEKVLVKE